MKQGAPVGQTIMAAHKESAAIYGAIQTFLNEIDWITMLKDEQKSAPKDVFAIFPARRAMIGWRFF